MTTPHRRMIDRQTDELEGLIAKENDESHRTLLLILNALNSTLQDNTIMTQEINLRLTSHLDRFSSHLDKYNEYVNKGKGVWLILMWIFTVAQAALGYTALTITQELKDHAFQISALQLEVAKQSEQHRFLYQNK